MSGVFFVPKKMEFVVDILVGLADNDPKTARTGRQTGRVGAIQR